MDIFVEKRLSGKMETPLGLRMWLAKGFHMLCYLADIPFL